jgi:hypothetical protein
MVMMCFIIFSAAQFSHVKILNVVKLICLPAILFFIVISMRVGIDMYGPCTILGNPVIALIYNDHTVFIDYLKALF